MWLSLGIGCWRQTMLFVAIVAFLALITIRLSGRIFPRLCHGRFRSCDAGLDHRDVFLPTFFMVILSASALSAQTWSQLTPVGGPPSIRDNQGNSAFDPSSDRMIVFGGGSTSGGGHTNDVWVLINADGLGGTPQWLNLSPSPDPVNGLPLGRQGAAIIY